MQVSQVAELVRSRTVSFVGLFTVILVACSSSDEGSPSGNTAGTTVVSSRCGDGVVQAPETCDDGNGVDDDGCTNQCTTARCGDRIVQQGEECDDGNAIEQDFCRTSCRLSACGDGVVHYVLGEQCDDGNTKDGDGCNATCQREPTSNGEGTCGDGIVQAWEACDDGNAVDDDACTNACSQARCGDGIVQAGVEKCDDGNGVDNDGCDHDCVSSAAVQIASGNAHTCVLTRTGAVRCFGAGGGGRLGYVNTRDIGDDETPVQAYQAFYANGDVEVGGKAVKITAGEHHTCALLDTGRVRCWGGNESGQLGYGHTRNIGDDEPPFSAGDVELTGNVIDVTAGAHHTCALLDTGRVRCWGDGGVIGYGHPTNSIGDEEVPMAAYATLPNGGDVDLGPDAVATAVAANNYRTCVVLTSGKVRCWGNGMAGELGYGRNDSDIGYDQTPAQYYGTFLPSGDVNLGSGKATALAAGAYHTCVRFDDGAVRCFGQGDSGRLGYPGYGNIDGIPGNTYASMPLGGNVDVGGSVVQLAAGTEHTCALLSSGGVRCWGTGSFGTLGYGNTSNVGASKTPAQAGDVPLGSSASQLSAGELFSCALLTTGAVRCWGASEGGRLGYGNMQRVGDDETPASVGDVKLFGPAMCAPPDCTPHRCGDGVLDPGENCDDGNWIDQDFCRNDCRVSRCGDGVVQYVLGEECDDGNVTSGDGCGGTCRREH